MRRTIIGISTSSSLKQVNILEQIRPSGTLRQTVPIVGIWSSSTNRAALLPISSAVPTALSPWITQEAMLPSGSRLVGSVDRYFAKLIELRRRSVQNKETPGSSSCVGVPCKQEACRITISPRQKLWFRGTNASPIFLGCRAPACKNSLPSIKTHANLEGAKTRARRGKRWN